MVQAWFKRWVRKLSLRRISNHLWDSPDPYDFDNKEPADYYRAYFTDQEDTPYARVMNCDGDSIGVRLWKGERFNEDAETNLENCLTWSLKVRRKYHEITVIYASEAEFLAKDWWHPHFARLRERVLQGTYQIITPIRAERLDVLAAILDTRLNDNDYNYIMEEDTISSEQIMVKMFGERVLRHREGGRISSRIDLILDSLVESGDVERMGDHTFRPRGQAITTVSQAATDDRRHRAITRLTAALVVVGILGVDWEKPLRWLRTLVGYFFTP